MGNGGRRAPEAGSGAPRRRDPAGPGPGARSRQAPRRGVGDALVQVFSGAFRKGWQNLLELVLLGLIWFVGMITVGLAIISPAILAKGGGLLLALLAVLLPLAVAAPATVGLFGAVDLIWAGEAIGPFDALRNFFRGFRHRYLRSVGLGALWGLVMVSLYANMVEDRHFIPPVLSVGVGILLLYIALFVVMINVYLIPIVALTEWDLWRAVRVATWEAVANPLYTISALLLPAAVVIVGAVLRPLLPLLVGGAAALFSTGALRFAPMRHPDLPAATTIDQPLDDDPRPGPVDLRPGVDYQEVARPGPEDPGARAGAGGSGRGDT